MIDVDFNSDNLWGLYTALSMRDRARIFRSAMRRSANELKAEAFKNLVKAVHVRDRAAMRKTIWTKIYTRTAGFRVSVAGNNHCYPSRMKNRKGNVRELPLARWLEDGTQESRRTGKGYLRGQLPAIGFLGEAAEQLRESTTSRLQSNLMTYIEKEARKYGCI